MTGLLRGTYREACVQRGQPRDDAEWEAALQDAAFIHTCSFTASSGTCSSPSSCSAPVQSCI